MAHPAYMDTSFDRLAFDPFAQFEPPPKPKPKQPLTNTQTITPKQVIAKPPQAEQSPQTNSKNETKTIAQLTSDLATELLAADPKLRQMFTKVGEKRKRVHKTTLVVSKKPAAKETTPEQAQMISQMLADCEWDGRTLVADAEGNSLTGEWWITGNNLILPRLGSGKTTTKNKWPSATVLSLPTTSLSAASASTTTSSPLTVTPSSSSLVTSSSSELASTSCKRFWKIKKKYCPQSYLDKNRLRREAKRAKDEEKGITRRENVVDDFSRYLVLKHFKKGNSIAFNNKKDPVKYGVVLRNNGESKDRSRQVMVTFRFDGETEVIHWRAGDECLEKIYLDYSDPQYQQAFDTAYANNANPIHSCLALNSRLIRSFVLPE